MIFNFIYKSTVLEGTLFLMSVLAFSKLLWIVLLGICEENIDQEIYAVGKRKNILSFSN